jgi:transposase
MMLAHVDFLDEALELCSHKIEQRLCLVAAALERLCTIPGVKRQTAALILSEVGADMSRFPTHKHLVAGAGLAPGHYESAGKHKAGATRKGSQWLRTGLVEAAQAAGRAGQTYLGAQFHRLKVRKGTKRAAVAVAQTMLVIAYQLLKDKTTDRERGSNYFDQQDKERVSRRLIQRLERLGYKIAIESAPPLESAT